MKFFNFYLLILCSLIIMSCSSSAENDTNIDVYFKGDWWVAFEGNNILKFSIKNDNSIHYQKNDQQINYGHCIQTNNFLIFYMDVNLEKSKKIKKNIGAILNMKNFDLKTDKDILLKFIDDNILIFEISKRSNLYFEGDYFMKTSSSKFICRKQ